MRRNRIRLCETRLSSIDSRMRRALPVNILQLHWRKIDVAGFFLLPALSRSVVFRGVLPHCLWTSASLFWLQAQAMASVRLKSRSRVWIRGWIRGILFPGICSIRCVRLRQPNVYKLSGGFCQPRLSILSFSCFSRSGEFCLVFCHKFQACKGEFT